MRESRISYDSIRDTFTIGGMEVTHSALLSLRSGESKSLYVASPDDTKNQADGPADTWTLIQKESDPLRGSVKLTRAMLVRGGGVLVEVSTRHGEHVAVALAYIPGACLVGEEDAWKVALPSPCY